jgi:SEC-C motif domain protein
MATGLDGGVRASLSGRPRHNPRAMATIAPNNPCPCGTGAGYAACCGRWHAGPQHLQAPTAEALMRSRYSAYALGLLDYLSQTWHPRTRPTSLAPVEPALRWLGLAVKCHEIIDDDHATVEFVARSKLGGRAQRLHEISRFERLDGRWFYVDGSVG